jgi:hypothetical protein
MSLAGLEISIPAYERLQTNALDLAVTGAGESVVSKLHLRNTGKLFCLAIRIHNLLWPFRVTAGIAVIQVYRESRSTCFLSVLVFS